jgi:hypothetical protein
MRGSSLRSTDDRQTNNSRVKRVATMSDGTGPSSSATHYAPFNVAALYATRAEADAAETTLQASGLPSGSVEHIDRGSPAWAILRGSVAGTDEALMRHTGRRVLIGVVIGGVIGLIVGLIIALIIHAASGSGSASVAALVGALVGLAIGAILGGFYSGATSLPRGEQRAAIGENAAAIAVHANDADTMAQLVTQLEQTRPQRLARFGPDGRPQPTRDTRPS